MTRLARIGILALAMSLCGCNAFEPRPDRTQFFVLATTTELGQASAPLKRLPAVVIVGVGPVVMPKYLDRFEIVRRSGASQVEISDYERWAEPLSGNVLRVLATNLAVLLDPARIRVFPWSPTVKPTYEVTIVVERFEPSAHGSVELIARWSIRTLHGERNVASKDTTIQHTAPSSSTIDVVATMSVALAELSREIASAIEQDAAS